MSAPSLPALDPEPQARRDALAERRELYRYRHDRVGGVAMALELPRDERPSLRWWGEVAEAFAELLSNMAAVAVVEHFDGEDDAGEVEAVEDGRERYDETLRGLIRDRAPFGRVFNYSLQALYASAMRGRPDSLDDYDRLFHTSPRPEVATRWREDWAFAHLRLAGPAPMVLTRVGGRLPPHFPVDERLYARALSALAKQPAYRSASLAGDTLAAALAEGRAFTCDYAGAEGIVGGNFPAAQKYISAPLVLLVSPPGGGSLMPVAIQCHQRPGPNNPIFTPADGHAWTQAKLAVHTAEGNLHEAVYHLGRTHLFMGAVVLASRRQLAPQHPVSVLLEPHLEGTLYINEQAKVELVATGGGVDYVLAGTVDSTRDAAASAVFDWNLDEASFARSLRRRGVGPDEALPFDYPYRDDGLLIWEALSSWVGDYLGCYYRDDAAVAGDAELQAFAAELIAEDGGRLRGWRKVGGGRFATRAELGEFLTHLLFTASAEHAAVNFPQAEVMAYAPAFPLAQYAPAPTRVDGGSMESLLAQLPSLEAAHVQLGLGVLLGKLYYSRLGDYRGLLCRHFDDERVHGAEDRLVAALEGAEATIEARNRDRDWPYLHLLPSRIPQSINA